MGNCTSGNKEDIKDKQAGSTVLTQADVELVKNSWKLVVQGGLREYGVNMMMRIFIEHKELKPLWRFAKDLETAEQMNSSQALKAHGEKLFNAIDMAVNSLDDLNTLGPILVQLGAIHYKYGVKEEHFVVIGEMLISTLKDGLKENFTDKVKNAWLKIFDVVQIQMKVGMKQAAQAIPVNYHDNTEQMNHSPSTNDNTNLENGHGHNDNTTNGRLVNDLEEVNLQTATLSS